MRNGTYRYVDYFVWCGSVAVLVRCSVWYLKSQDGSISRYERTWIEQRRFTLRTLKDFGFGKSGMEEMILEEINEFIPFIIEESKNGSITMMNLFNISILNILWRIVNGTRYDYRNPELQHLTNMVNEVITSAGPKFSIAMIFPGIRKIWPNVDPFEKNCLRAKPVIDFIEKSITEHEMSFRDDQSPRDFIDMFLNEMKNTTDTNSSFHGKTGRNNLKHTLIDLFFAGSETTSSTLTWAILYLILNPDKQEKARNEILTVIGPNRNPRLLDRTDLPYTEAMIQEIQRLGNIAPFGLPHSTLKTSVWIGDICIPKGYTIQPHFGGIMKSQKIWGQDALEFKPERFINNDKLIKDDRVIPFSVGKRQCPGENLARAEIFLYLSTILQRLSLSQDESEAKPSVLDFVSGITAVPMPFKTKVKVL